MKKITFLGALLWTHAFLTAQPVTFNYTGGVQTYTVPACVTSIIVDIQGAQGGLGPLGCGGITGQPGLGGRTQATIPVTPGDVLSIYVGGAGANDNNSSAAGGFNGGGTAMSEPSYTYYGGGGGGGASDIRLNGTALTNRVVVAGGGGGGGSDGCTCNGLNGGNGGGLTASPGAPGGLCSCNPSGQGGTQLAGGVKGDWGCTCNATAGSLGLGGNSNSSSCGGPTGGGAGGGGYYGGGGGGLGAGGGGSNFTIGTATGVTNTIGFRTGNGLVIITPVSGTPTPGPITGSTTICANASGNYSIASMPGATTYTWSVPAGSTINSGQGTTAINITAGTTSGNISVTATFPCGTSAPTTLSLTINPAPTVSFTASPSTTVCAGSSVTLSGTGATSYSWSGGITNGVAFVPPSTTTYTVTGTSASGCTNTANATVTVNPLPTISGSASPSSICVGASTTLTASGGTTYTWMPGSLSGTSVTVSPSSTTTYTITGTNSNGCVNTGNVTVTVNPLPNVLANTTASAVCAGNTVTLTGSGATTYTWSGGVTNGVPFIPVSTLTYTVTGTNGNGCTATDNVTVTVNPLPVVTASASPSSLCAGSSTTLTGGGATSYSWTDGVTNGVGFIPLSTHTYTVTGTDGNGCNNVATVTVTVNPLPTVGSTASPSATVCTGSSVTLNGTGATTYTWSGGVTNGVAFVPVSTTTYTVTGTSAAGCTNTATQLVTVNPLPTVGSTASPSATVCAGSSVTLNGTGATTYTWSGGVINGVAFVPVSTTTYTVTGTSAAGCTNTATQLVTVNPLPTVGSTASPSSTVCAGSSVTLSGTGASTYTWSGGVINGISFVPVSTTTYTVTGTSAAGCSNTATQLVTVNPLPTVGSTASPSTTVCAGSSVTLNGTGATTYTWSGGVTNGISFVPVSTTTYTVTGTDGNGCTNTASTTVTVNPLPTVTANSTASAVCTGNSVTLTGGGATTYTWSGGVTDGVAFVPTSTTTYTVTGTNGNGCTNTATTTVIVNPLPTVTANSTASAVCAGNSVTLTGGGATTYTWSGGVTNGISFIPVTTTTYTVTGTDGNGCMNTASTTVTVNALPVVVASVSNATICVGNSTTVSATGASTYNWTPGSFTGSSVSVSPASTVTYTVVGTDGNGCTNSDNVTVTVNPLPTVTASSTASAVCAGNSVTLTGGGATSYSWSGGVTDGISFVPTSTTTYTVTGTDANGCSNTASTTVTVNSLPVVALGPDVAQCAGTVVLDAQNAGSTYMWNDNSTSQTLTASSTGIYWVDVTNSNGCTSRDSITVTINSNPSVALGADITQCAGTVTLDAQNAGATYLWSDNSTNQMLTVTTSGTYSVLVTLTGGCTATDAINVTINPVPVVNLGPDQAICSGTVPLDAQNAGATYLWSDNSLTQTISATTTGIYWVDVMNSFGCVSRDSVNITINSNPVVALGADITQCGGTTTLDAGNAGATYLWSDNSTNQMLTVTTSGTYSVLVTLTGGCTATDAINITINTVPTVTLGVDVTQCGGSVTLDAQNAGATYLWSDNSTAQTLPVNTTGNYSVMVTDPSTGCMNSDTAMITINVPPVVALGADITQCGGSVTLDAQNAGATYLWSDNSTAQTLSVNTTGSYSVTVTDPSTGCMNSDAITVTINAAPSVALGPDATQCGGSVTINAQNVGSTYLWSDNSTNQLLIVTATGNYFVMVTDPSTGCSNGDTIMITINTLPVITFSVADTVCINDAALILSATPAGGTFSGPGVAGSSFSPPTAGLGNATVAYSFTDANGCSASSQQVVNVDACTGVVELNNNGSISVFPNPNNGNFTVQITNANGEGVLEVTDALGQVISSQSLSTTGGSLTKEISLANYSSGVYFVRFTTNNSTSVQKVIIQR